MRSCSQLKEYNVEEVSSKLSNTTITMLTTSIYTPAVIFASYVYDLV